MESPGNQDRRPRIHLGLLYAAAFGLLMLLWHPGVSSNDDVGQATGLYFLSRGRLDVTNDIPVSFAEYYRGAFRHFSLPKEDGVAVPPFDSTLLNVLALPIMAVLLTLTSVVGYHGALGLVQAAAVGAGFWAALALAGKPSETRWRWAALLAIPLALGALTRNPDVLPEPFVEFASIQAVNMAATAAAAVLLFDLLRRRMPEPAALLGAGTFLLATPMLFWGVGVKDHAMAAAGLVVALWCYRDGHRSDLLHTFAAFAVTGLMLWHHFRLGLFQLVALGLLALPAVRLGLVPFLQRAAAGVLGLLPGLAIDAWQRLLHARLGLKGDWGDLGTPVPGAEGPTGGFGIDLGGLDRGLLSHSILSEPLGVLEALRQVLVWTEWMQMGATLSFICIFPALGAAVATLSSRRLRAVLPRPVLAFAIAYPLLLFGIAGNQLLKAAYGLDPRYALTLWPSVVLLAAPAIADLAQKLRPRVLLERVAYVAVPWLALTLALILVLRALFGVFTPQGNLFDETVFMRYGGLLVGAVLVFAWPLALRLAAWARAVAWLGPAALAMALQFQVFVLLSLAKADHHAAPMVAWPLELVRRGVLWMIYPNLH